MKFFRDTTEFFADRKSAVTLGKFDGLHRGHQVLTKDLFAAKNQGFQTVVFTFGTHPRALVDGHPQELLLTNDERHDRLEAEGLDVLVEYPFNETTSHTAPDLFIKKILTEQLKAKIIIVGTDFCFGYRRAGNVELLRKMSGECGYKLVVKEKLKTKEGIDISSSYIKELLKLGHMEKVNDLLGYTYSIRGEVIHGNHYGRTFGMPTINQVPEKGKLLPPNGVYVSRTYVDGKYYRSVTNIGVKPTIDGIRPRGAETFIQDFSGDLYGKTVEVELYSYARPEIKFENGKQLEEQMYRDRAAAMDYWKDKKGD
ncbi:MAG: bifunctional riboflavin kinase/FAD synthetase [Lachnospiraceae bacterium]|nr:bifunctional riboflavin kinase/FAD synthetase [Lachnospiraceae bacterium]